MGHEPTRPGSAATEAHVGFWSFDIASGLSFVDPPISALFGVDPVEGARGVARDRLRSCIHPDDRNAAAREMERVLQRHDLCSWFYRLRNADGTFDTMHAVGRCFEDMAGRPTHFSGILMRIEQHEQHPIESELIDRLASLRDLAKLTPDPMLPRLIEAVMLHVGRELAKELEASRGRN